MDEAHATVQPVEPPTTGRANALIDALDAATTTDEVYRTIVETGAHLAEASAASVALLDATGEWIDIVEHRGYSEEVIQRLARFQADADLPLAEAIRTERRLYFTDRAELIERYEGVRETDVSADRAAMAALPLRLGGHVIGAVGLSFDHGVELDDDLRAYLEVLVEHGGEAIDRTVSLTPAGARFRQMVEAARGRLAFVSAATRELSRSLERDEVLQTLTQLVVPRFADWASVLLPEGGQLVAATLVHRDVHGDQRERAGRFRTPIDGDTPSATVFRSGQATLARGVDDDLRARMDAYPELRDQLGATKERIVVPITSQGRTLGVLTLGEDDRTSFDDDDLAVALELASRAGTALDNASRYETERDMAEVLQRAILPAELPTRPEVRLTARYLPATHTAQVGGDWYDAFELRDGRLGLCVGDVVGHGLTSAACMGQLRNALRVYALDGAAPNAVIEALNRFTIDTAVTNFTTLLYAILDPVSGQLDWTSAGHPAMVCRRGGKVETLPAGHGMPIGIMDHEYTMSTTTLELGDLVLIYTDGLIERRREPLTEGMQRLASAVEGKPTPFLDDLVDHVLAEVAPEDRADDICVLAMERWGI
jgi:serine phosphatase RsbU (regulator of sigma subunit)